jgi:hypothetical protein
MVFYRYLVKILMLTLEKLPGATLTTLLLEIYTFKTSE